MKSRAPSEQALKELSERVALRLTFLREGLTQAKVAELTGVSQGTVSKWSMGKPPSVRVLPKLAKALGMSLDYLLTGEEREAEPVVGFADEDKVAVPRLISVAAGAPVCHPMGDRRSVLVDRRSLQKQVGPIPETQPERVVYAADVRGESMSPGIQDGDVLIVRRYYPPTREAMRAGQAIIESGELYLVAPDGDGDVSVKRLVLTSGHELLVLSDNPKWKPKKIDLREVGLVQHVVLGRPVKLIRDL